MKISARIKHIERALQDQINIPNSEKFIVAWPNDTEEEKEIKVKNLLEELKQKYGESVTRQDIGIMKVVYIRQQKEEI